MNEQLINDNGDNMEKTEENTEEVKQEPVYSLIPTTKYRKDYSKYLNQKAKLQVIKEMLVTLAYKGVEGIDKKHRPHLLKGNYKGYWECHILPDLLLIWEQDDEEKEITLYRIGSHSELF
jgi:addiction module toxin, relE/stbE family